MSCIEWTTGEWICVTAFYAAGAWQIFKWSISGADALALWLIRKIEKRPHEETAAETLARPDAWARFMVDMRSDALSDEVYMEIYKGDLEAIAEAKASWARAGEQMIEETRKLRERYEY